MDTTKHLVCEGIRKFVAETFLVNFDLEAGPDTDLFEAGFIDSFGFVELVTFLEQTYGVRLDEDDFESPLIATLAGIQSIAVDRAGVGR